MILNQEVIHKHVLKQTLQQQIRRLASICDPSYIATLENRLRLTQRNYQLLVYEHNQNRQQLNNSYLYRCKVYEDLLQDKIICDEQINKAVLINHKLLASLQLKRKELKNKQSEVDEAHSQLNQTMQSFQQEQHKIQHKQHKRNQLLDNINSLEEVIFQSNNQTKWLHNSIQAQHQKINLEAVGLSSIQIDNQALINQIKDLRRELLSRTQIIQKQNKVCSATLESLCQQLNDLRSQKQLKNTDVSKAQIELCEQQQREKLILNNINSIQQQYKRVQQQIVSKISLSQQISAKIFQARVNRTNLRTSSNQSSNKLCRLKQLKKQLWKIMTKDC